jgi:hypothetical protein
MMVGPTGKHHRLLGQHPHLNAGWEATRRRD